LMFSKVVLHVDWGAACIAFCSIWVCRQAQRGFEGFIF
jgi:hypothetical protein